VATVTVLFGWASHHCGKSMIALPEIGREFFK